MDAIFATFKSPGSQIILGPISIRWYGILIAISVLIGLNISNYLAKKRLINNGIINDLLPILIFTAIIGARIYYVAFEWQYYKYNLLEVFAIWKGGIAIHGALLGGTLAVLIFCRLKKQPFWDLLDVLLPSVSLGQAIGRWGNFFNNEAFGIPTNLPWKLFIPTQQRPTIFSNFEYFHPTFLYESIWNLLIFLVLIIIFHLGLRKKVKIPSGVITCLYLIFYSIGRYFIEALRVDSLCIGSYAPLCQGGIRVAQLISIMLFIISSLSLWRIYIKNDSLSENVNKKV